MPSQRVLLTVEEAAEALGIKRTFAWRLVGDGSLASVKIGKHRRVPLIDLENYVEKLREEAE